jgi:hypothetical protein
MVGELCGCTKDRKKSHSDEMGGLQGITKSQLYPISYEEEKIMKWKYLQKEQGQGVQEYTYDFWSRPSGWVSLLYIQEWR